MRRVKIAVRLINNASYTEISGDAVEKAQDEVLKNEIGYSLLSVGVARGQGVFTEAEPVAVKLGRAGFDVKLDKSDDNKLKEGIIRWLAY